jgi:hypothetical protein
MLYLKHILVMDLTIRFICDSAVETCGPRSSGTRITVSIPPGDYDVILRMAKERKVSASWIVRDAVEKYIQGEASLPR